MKMEYNKLRLRLLWVGEYGPVKESMAAFFKEYL